MADYNAMFNHPLTILGAQMMSGFDPSRQGLGGLGSGLAGTGQVMRQQAQLDEENERARALADLQMQTYQAKLAQGQQNLSKTPTYIRNPKTGQVEILQLSSSGAPTRTEIPEGYEPALPLSFQDVGTHLLGFQRGAQTPSVAIEQGLSPEAQPATRAAQTEAVETAKSQTAARLELPAAQEKATLINEQIDSLINHPGLESGTGKSAMLPVFPGTDRMDFETRKAQLTGGTFLQAIQEMRQGGGVGQITELEGEKAQAAVARMEAATKKEDFVEALEDYRKVVNAAAERKAKEAGATNKQPVVDWNELP